MNANPSLPWLKNVVNSLKDAKSVLCITGAGMSADSGLPTYRGLGGLYQDSQTEDGIPIEMVLSGQMIHSNPKLTWKYLSQIENNCRKVSFNRGHEILALMEQRFERFWILTQNIDGFHTKAGSKNVIEIHGNMHRLRCPVCGWRTTIESFEEISIPPTCKDCARIARPDVVFFGEMLPTHELMLYQQQLRQGFDVYLWIGTTAVFPYIQQPLQIAQADNSLTIEINPVPTIISNQVNIQIPQKSAETLELIWQDYSK